MGFQHLSDHPDIKHLQMLFATHQLNKAHSMKYCHCCKEKWFEGKKKGKNKGQTNNDGEYECKTCIDTKKQVPYVRKFAKENKMDPRPDVHGTGKGPRYKDRTTGKLCPLPRLTPVEMSMIAHALVIQKVYHLNNGQFG